MDIDKILTQAAQMGASDVHLFVGRPPVLRLSGGLKSLEGYEVLTPEVCEQLAFSLLSEKQIESFKRELEMDSSYTVPGVSRFRVNIYMDNNGIGAALRLIPSVIPTPKDIDLPESVMALTHHRNGLVLVTGPTGSGKSTTLAAMIDSINSSRDCHIMTVEDPIEFVYEHKMAVVNQREVESHTNNFGQALKHFLRQDPDVLLVGEMRDLETIASTITLAETGHLVFATLHTVDAPQTVDRVIDVFPPYQQQQIRAMLGGTLRGVVSQQLIPRADGKGRVAAREIMIVTPAVANLIREGKTHQIYSALQTGRAMGMVTMDAAVEKYLESGAITAEAAKAAMSH
ncbi:MAG: type IV pilus twitching motility protein PilT [Candidatus Omnitrophica bacterium]|nr:type IV pilus twitching motility protein PilT [Candidatus Omnitrophota bacterium]